VRREHWMLRRIAMILALLTVLSHTSRAACGSISFEQLLAHPDVAAVFRATVVHVRSVTYPLPEGLGPAAGQVATLHVTTLWKGDVARDTVLYFGLGESQRQLELRQEYLFIAMPLSEVGRRQFGVAADVDQPLRANEFGCGAMPFDRPSTQQLIGIVPGRPPR